MAGWFDSHCHVQEAYLPGHEAGATDPGPVLARAAEAGVDRLICIGTGAATSQQAVAWPGRRPPGPRPPGHGPPSGCTRTRRARASTRWRRCWRATLGAEDGAVVAVGECGLDYYYEHSPRDAQRAAFAAQIALAHALRSRAGDPRAATRGTISSTCSQAEGVPERTVLHCFTGGPTRSNAACAPACTSRSAAS